MSGAAAALERPLTGLASPIECPNGEATLLRGPPLCVCQHGKYLAAVRVRFRARCMRTLEALGNRRQLHLAGKLRGTRRIQGHTTPYAGA